MKRFAVIVVFFLSSFTSFSQGKYGFEAGAGYTTFSKSYFTAAFQGYLMGRISRTFYAGGVISFQRYSMLYSNNPSTPVFGDVLSIRQKSDYLFFTPKIEMGIGYHKHLFANFSLGPGVYLGGNQWTHKYQPLWYNPSGGSYGVDTAFTNTSYNVPNFAFRFTAGLKQRFTTHRYWNIVVSEELSFIPTNLNKVGPPIKANYFCITVGVMHKFPSVAMEED